MARIGEIVEIARPLGPIFAVTPITNPTSTALFKILIALKSRNPLIIRPHGAAKKCTIQAAKLCYEAARAAAGSLGTPRGERTGGWPLGFEPVPGVAGTEISGGMRPAASSDSAKHCHKLT